jgi:hypothetical protein
MRLWTSFAKFACEHITTKHEVWVNSILSWFLVATAFRDLKLWRQGTAIMLNKVANRRKGVFFYIEGWAYG